MSKIAVASEQRSAQLITFLKISAWLRLASHKPLLEKVHLGNKNFIAAKVHLIGVKKLLTVPILDSKIADLYNKINFLFLSSSLQAV